MMSSEEDLDLSDGKGKSSSKQQTKRVRQRVDAGEPRNSYASIPNFSSRPPGSYVGAAATVNGFASKMLCDLIGSSGGLRSKEDMILDSGGQHDRTSVNGVSPRGMFMNGGELLFGGRDSPERCSSAESSSSHLLRDILLQQQGRSGGGHGPKSPLRAARHDEDSTDESNKEGRMSAAQAADNNCNSPGCSSSSERSNSPPVESLWQDVPPTNQQQSSSSVVDVKRARVETIVNNMLQGPTQPQRNGNANASQQTPVNGCKKRKLYQPQQHEATTPSKNGDSELYEEEEEDCMSDAGGSPVAKRSRNATGIVPPYNPELFSFKQQIRQVQQQLVALQQQYMEMVVDSAVDDVPTLNSCNTNNNERPRSVDDTTTTSDCEDTKPRIMADNNNKYHPPTSRNSKPFLDYDNASLYGDEQRRLVIDDSKDDPVGTTSGKSDDPLTTRQSCIVQQQQQPCPNLDYEWLAESLKAELSTSLSQVVDAVVSRCVQRKAAAKVTSSSANTPESSDPSPKDPTTLLSQMLDRKSPRTGKVIDRGTRVNGGLCGGGLRTSPYPPDIVAAAAPKPSFFFPLKPPTSVAAATAAFLYGSPPQGLPPHSYPSPAPSTPQQDAPEQTEAMSLVVTPKKKRHKVTDTRLHQRPGLCGTRDDVSPKYMLDPLPPVYHHPPPPLVPVSLPTTVAIPNPSLNQSELFHGFHHSYDRLSSHFGGGPHMDSGPPQGDDDGGPPLQMGALHHPMLPFHPHQRGSPDSLHLSHHLKQASNDNNGDMSDAGDNSPAAYDSGMALISFPHLMHTSTLTPMHLRKAKLMFFYARYPSSAVLKMYFPDIKFNKNNTAQLVKWFSNFREFFYIQMEKYARQAMSEGIKTSEDLKVNSDSELLRVLNLHYNRNNHIEAPENFRYVVEQTLREFFKALVAGKDSEQSWKKSIYKIIARLDDNVPEYFKNPNFLESLE